MCAPTNSELRISDDANDDASDYVYANDVSDVSDNANDYVGASDDVSEDASNG
jgi:hypothetical protein